MCEQYKWHKAQTDRKNFSVRDVNNTARTLMTNWKGNSNASTPMLATQMCQ